MNADGGSNNPNDAKDIASRRAHFTYTDIAQLRLVKPGVMDDAWAAMIAAFERHMAALDAETDDGGGDERDG